MRRLAHGSGLESAQHGRVRGGMISGHIGGKVQTKARKKAVVNNATVCLPQQQTKSNRNRHNSHDNYNGLMIPVYRPDIVL